MMLRSILLILLSAAFVTGCASSKFKQRKEQRDSLVKSQGIYCEMINGDMYPDVEVQMNIEMAKRCDPNKSYSITNYRAPTSDTVGLIYCCTLSAASKEDVEVKPPSSKKSEAKAEPKSDKKADSKPEKSEEAAPAN